MMAYPKQATVNHDNRITILVCASLGLAFGLRFGRPMRGPRQSSDFLIEEVEGE